MYDPERIAQATRGALTKLTACVLMLLLVAPMAEALPGAPATDQAGAQQAGTSTVAVADRPAYPDAPAPQQPAVPTPQQQPTDPGSSSSSAVQQDNKPVGTAAAPYEKTTGIPGSRPAGAAIAPGKQRRARAIFIRVGIVVAAAAATGAVVALSQGSSSRPQ